MSVSSPMKSPLRESAARSHTNQGFTKSLPQFLPGVPGVTSAGADPDDPIYDYVASDDDYYHIPEPSSLGGSVNAEFSQSNPDSNRTSGNTYVLLASPLAIRKKLNANKTQNSRKKLKLKRKTQNSGILY